MKPSYQFAVRGQLLSINNERKLHHQRRAEWVRQWRSDAGWEIKRARLPHLERVAVIAQPFQHAHALGDCGNHLPSVKAVVDALVDVGTLPGDGPNHVASLTMMAPRRTGEKVDRLEIEVIEVSD
jgi:hypothetical protein